MVDGVEAGSQQQGDSDCFAEFDLEQFINGTYAAETQGANVNTIPVAEAIRPQGANVNTVPVAEATTVPVPAREEDVEVSVVVSSAVATEGGDGGSSSNLVQHSCIEVQQQRQPPSQHVNSCSVTH